MNRKSGFIVKLWKSPRSRKNELYMPVETLLDWPHCLYNKLKRVGMCAAACSMWWLGWILFYKTTQPEGSYQSRGTWSTGAALVSALTNGGRGGKKLNPVTFKQKQALSIAPMVAMVVLCFFFSCSLVQHFLLDWWALSCKAQGKQ